MLAYYQAAPQQSQPQRQYGEVDEALENLVRSIDVPVDAGVPLVSARAYARQDGCNLCDRRCSCTLCRVSSRV